MRAIAFMYAYNEADIIAQSVRHAVEQGLHVHVTDNWSDDRTYAIVGAIAAADPRVTVSRWPESGPADQVSWADMLRRVEQLAAGSGFDWCIHYDADEIRRSSRPAETLLEAIARLDAAGYNAVDHDVQVFEPREGFDGSKNPEAWFTVKQVSHIDQRNGQVKCWKQPPGQQVELAAGGHKVRFPGIRIAPERFVLKHYPLRTAAQAQAKLASRRERWAKADRDRGWHVQYDGAGAAIVTLTRFPDLFARLARSIDRFEPAAQRIVVTSGGAQVEAPGWKALRGVEPFIFARNANLGIAAAGNRDVLLINDDCRLVAPVIDTLSAVAEKNRAGILSPQICGGVGNPLQRAGASIAEFYESIERLTFVCVWLPAATRLRVGLLDESFDGYGGDDVDYCRRAAAAGLTLGVTASAVVVHGHGRHPQSSSFRRVMSEADQARSMRRMDALARRKAGIT